MSNVENKSTLTIETNVSENLKPQENRIMDNWSYLMAWIGGCVFLGYFMLGASLVPPVGDLNLIQAIVCISVSAIIVSVCFNINGQAGHKYGIPFVIQARHAFGIKGTMFPSILRAVPAICWYGIQSWVGAMALNTIAKTFVGFDNVFVMFVAFQLLQMFLSSLGFSGIKWVENIGSVIIVVSLGYMLYVIISTYGTLIQSNLIDIKGSWGLSFWGGTTAFLGVYTTLMLNISDYTREYTKKGTNKKMLLIHIIGTLPTTLFMGLIGLLAAGVTGNWDPIVLFTEVMPNPIIMIIALLFVAIAQITTNVMLNVIPPAYVMMDMFKISYKKGALITGLLAFATFPWKIATADYFNKFIQFYSIFLGPIFAVMVVDYYFVRKKNLDINNLYDEKGPYVGVNWAGIIAVLIGSAFGALILEISWYISLLPAGISYYMLMKYFGKRNSRFVPESFKNSKLFSK